MSGWSNKESLSFLEYYKREPTIWNPKDINHKDKRKVGDAWSRIAQLTGKPVKELKNKKEILMATFRKYLKKKKEYSHRSGEGAKETYKPTWFAFETMESFLQPVYTGIDGIHTETQSQQNAILEEIEDDSLQMDHTTITTPSTSTPSTVTNKRLRLVSETAEPEQQMAAAFGQLTNVLGQKQSENRPEDDCDLYGKLLALKLRELTKDERKVMMYQIDGLFINRIYQNSHAPYAQSPQYYSGSSSMNSAYSRRHTPSPQSIPSDSESDDIS